MLRDRRLWFAAVPVAVSLGILLGSVLTRPAISQQQLAPPVSDPVAMEHAESLSSAFRLAAHAVLPTVVKIKSTVKERRILRRGDQAGENPFRGTPFEDFFREDFGGRFEQRRPRQEGLGSGVIIDATGVILTNNHVVQGADVVTVVLADGREFTAEDVRTDPQTDIAVVRIKEAGELPAAQLGDSDVIDIGDWVLAVGNPFELEASVSAGIISAKGRSLDSASRASFLQTDAAINPGNSGGPLVNLRGQVVGINTAIASSSGGYQGIGFAVPINQAKWVIDQLLNKGSVSRAWLGIGISALNQGLAESLSLDPRTRGILVTQVSEDAPAERAGVQAGDVITHLGDQAVTTPTELQRAVERAPLGSQQTLHVLRQGRKYELTVKTEALPDDIANRSPDSDEGAEEPEQGIEVTDLGMQIADLDQRLTDRLGLPANTTGVVVVDVDADGIAAANGVRPGMLIAAVDGNTIKSAADFATATKSIDVARGITFTVKIPGVGTRFLVIKER